MKILIIKNIPSPYRNYLFKLMQEIFPQYGIEFEVWYMARTEPDRHWKFDKADFAYPHRFLSGFALKISNTYAHTNFSLLFSLGLLKYDLAIVGGIFAPSLWIAPFLMNGVKKIIWSESNLISSTQRTGLSYWFKRFLVNQYDGYIIPGVRAKEYVEYFSSPATTRPFFNLPNLIDPELFCQKVSLLRQNKTELKEKYKVVNPNNQVWLISARLTETKGIIPFLEAAQDIHQVTLLIAGEGHLRDQLEKLIQKIKLDVILLGALQQQSMLELYATSDLFILPSFSDPSPLSAIEAIAAGLPLLISCHIGNAPEVLIDNTNGWSFSPEDSKEFKQKLFSKIASEPLSKLQEMGRASSTVYDNNFNSESVLKRLAVDLTNFLNK